MERHHDKSSYKGYRRHNCTWNRWPCYSMAPASPVFGNRGVGNSPHLPSNPSWTEAAGGHNVQTVALQLALSPKRIGYQYTIRLVNFDP